MSEQNLIAAGRHQALCRSIQFGWTSGENSERKRQIAIGFELVDEGDADRGRHITFFGYFTDAAEEFALDAIRNVGYQGDDLAELPQLAEDGKLDQVVSLNVKHEEYKGQLQARVAFVNRVGGAVQLKEPMEEAELKRFAAEMRSRMRSPAPSQRRAGAPSGESNRGGSGGGRTTHPNAPRGMDDDIPFASSAIESEPRAVARALR